VSGSAIVALVAAVFSLTAAGCVVYLLLRARAGVRTLEQEFERGRTMFAEVVEREAAERARELEQALKLARAESLSALVEEERRITEERRRDVAERERDASTRLTAALTEAERRVDERLSRWASDLAQLQESLGAELAAIGQRLAHFAGDAEAKITDEAERLQDRGEIGRASCRERV